MKTLFRTTDEFMTSMRADLARPHHFAHERIGFVTVRAAQGHDNLVILAERYYPVADQDYVNDPFVGARIGQEALRKALELALLEPVGVFHVHMHLIPSRRLWFSQVDLNEQMKFVPDFFSVRPEMPHGTLVLSPHSIAGIGWLARDRAAAIDEFNITGRRLQVIRASDDGSTDYRG